MRLIKLIILFILIFFGLYYCGDFRVNDVHVRSYLQEKIPEKTLKSYISGVYDYVSSFFKEDSSSTGSVIAPKSKSKTKKPYVEDVDPKKGDENHIGIEERVEIRDFFEDHMKLEQEGSGKSE
jgi:hypothetical protein